MATLVQRPRTDDASVTGVLLSGGFALGVLLLSSQEGFSRDLSAYLVGSIVTVRPSDIWLDGGGARGRPSRPPRRSARSWCWVGFDRDGAAAAGYPVRRARRRPAVAHRDRGRHVGAGGRDAAVGGTDRRARGGGAALGLAGGADDHAGGRARRGSGVAGVLLSRAVDVAAGGAVALVLAAVFVLSVLLSDGGPVRRLAVAATPQNEMSPLRDLLRPQRADTVPGTDPMRPGTSKRSVRYLKKTCSRLTSEPRNCRRSPRQLHHDQRRERGEALLHMPRLQAVNRIQQARAEPGGLQSRCRDYAGGTR